MTGAAPSMISFSKEIYRENNIDDFKMKFLKKSKNTKYNALNSTNVRAN
jgi:hypothetical protein